MYKKDYQFHTPPQDTVVWRYLDFVKFIDLLTTQELFFCRSDKFDDPYEGLFRFMDAEGMKSFAELLPLTKKFYFLNCWHINEHQSDAMWKIFTGTRNGIAIKSTVNRIIQSLVQTNDDIYIGRIYYRDLEKLAFEELELEPQNQVSENHRSTNQFNYKRISFEHERELRLYFVDTPIPHAIRGGIPREPMESKRVSVDVKLLISEIVVAPIAEKWFKDLVTSVARKLGFDLPVSSSTLYSP